MTDKESCPLCDSETRSACEYCSATGEVDLPQSESALYKAVCICGQEKTVAWDNVGPLDFERIKCSNCQEPLLFEFVGWGLVDN
jgi:hypothetical protein